MAKWTGSKPGGPQSKNLIPLPQRSPEEQLEIRRKGQKASVKKQLEKKRLSEVVRTVLAMGYEPGKVVDPDKITSFADALGKNVPIQTLIVMREVEKYLTTGDIEARNWLIRYGFTNRDEIDPNAGEPIQHGDTGAGGVPVSEGDGVCIHLIRGEKPKVQEEKATPAPEEGVKSE